jgi:hypothetical protein
LHITFETNCIINSVNSDKVAGILTKPINITSFIGTMRQKNKDKIIDIINATISTKKEEKLALPISKNLTRAPIKYTIDPK